MVIWELVGGREASDSSIRDQAQEVMQAEEIITPLQTHSVGKKVLPNSQGSGGADQISCWDK